MKESTRKMIVARLEEARRKFPVFTPQGGGNFEAMSLAGEECGEMMQAVNDGDLGKAVDEALDTITVCVRFIEGEAA